MIIFGTRRYVYQLAMVVLVCGRCGSTAAHAIRRRVVKFTLFFIPLFPISSTYSTQCTACGVQHKLPKDQAEQFQAGQAPMQQGAAQL
ncbi:zinc-ribbon domain-containing protein [Streptacidiphilus sp. PB12-B1b]|uniref:zinc-ribbon domain-containing protein n=1 Tax=Streptacidiphilus sp. PB12-B1b TaxID=2705012 RepID=UPI0015FAE37C|nr:zinc-ribbon domain-containing protein [Streptacidiphilus sp. PB12-B1b]QMU77887.1 zinc-ribbon domain-containing protein [Streptacidiphilus sp. PB12-B1b]